MIVNIYSKDTLEIIGRPVISSLEDFEKEPNLFFPDFNKENHIISEIEYQNPILEKGKLREMTKEELYAVGRYTLASNEMIENDKIITVNLSEFEYIEDNQIKYRKEEKIEALKKELYTLRIEKEKEPFEFEVNGTKYLQNNRSIDQSNLTRIAVMCQAMKKTTFDNWKFYTKDNSEKYVNISLTDIMRMAEIMQEQTTKSMATETLLSHNLENLTEEELKNYNVKERYEKAYGEMR